MQEQERIANEEAEKRLRAALTAKKPLNSASRVASPGIGAAVTDIPTDSAAIDQDAVPKEDTAMETEPTSPASVPPVPEVWLNRQMSFAKISSTRRILGFRNSCLCSTT